MNANIKTVLTVNHDTMDLCVFNVLLGTLFCKSTLTHNLDIYLWIVQPGFCLHLVVNIEVKTSLKFAYLRGTTL